MLHGQGVERHTDDDSEGDDGKRHAVKEQAVEQQQPVQHRLQKQEDEDIADDFHGCCLTLQREYPHGLS